MGYIPVPPKKANPKPKPKPKPKSSKAQNPVPLSPGGSARTDYGGYRRDLNDVYKGLPHRISLYDIDLVLEVDGQIKAIFEWKEYATAHDTLSIPFFEYVAMKKISKLLHVSPYIVIHSGDLYHIHPLNRWEDAECRDRITVNGRQHAVFAQNEVITLDFDGFRDYMRGIAG